MRSWSYGDGYYPYGEALHPGPNQQAVFNKTVLLKAKELCLNDALANPDSCAEIVRAAQAAHPGTPARSGVLFITAQRTWLEEVHKKTLWSSLTPAQQEALKQRAAAAAAPAGEPPAEPSSGSADAVLPQPPADTSSGSADAVLPQPQARQSQGVRAKEAQKEFRKKANKSLMSRKGGHGHECKKAFRQALEDAAGGSDPVEMAKAVRVALSSAEAAAFLEAFEPLAGKPDSSDALALGAAVAAEVASCPRQTASSAMARAAQSLSWGNKKLKNRTGVVVGDKFWKGAKAKPVKLVKNAGGRPRIVDNQKLSRFVKKFFLKHSQATSRFCRTKQRHQKAADRKRCNWDSCRVRSKP